MISCWPAILDGWWAAFRQLILPAVTMALFVIAPTGAYHTRLDAGFARQRFVRTARSIGLSWWRIVVTYALRNAILPVITNCRASCFRPCSAPSAGGEGLFLPGVASYALDALLSSDYAPVQGFVLLMASIFVVVNLLVDVLYGIADPRVSI